ncbi:MAG: flagellar biosynthetic protein FliR [Gammaproteobacteria bacterium]|nr:flagellar biosynthetic protein FliR [Gammaproteobacteria bacterium]
MELSSAEIAAWVGSFMWPFIRIGAMFMAMPVIGTQNVPVRVRLAITLAVTVVIAPQLSDLPIIDPFSLNSWLLIIQQVLIGVAMGFALQLVFSAVITGGQIIALQMGLGFASMVDPSSGLQVPMVSQLYLLAVILIFLAFNGHLVLIEILGQSFETLPIGSVGIARDSIWQLVSWGSDMFAGAVLIALPTVGALLVVNISFGVMTRASPQLNIFAVGFAIMLGVGFAVIIFTLPSLVNQTSKLLENSYGLIRALIGG